MNQQLHIVGVQFSAFTRAVQFCCEEIGVNYTLGAVINGQEYRMGSQALKPLNPFIKMPILLDGERVLYETQSICRYLDNTYNQARLQASDPWQKTQVDQWCAAITAYVDKVIVRDYLLEFLFPKGENNSVRMDAVAAAIPAVINLVEILEQQLGERDFLVGEQFTLADIMLAPALTYLVAGPNNTDLVKSNSVLRKYAARLLARPAAKSVFIPIVR